MPEDAAARFDAALKQAEMTLDQRDRAAALRVFVSLERAAQLLQAEEAVSDAPR